MLLQDLEELSKVIGIAVADGNSRFNPKYAFNGSNIGKIFSVFLFKNLLKIGLFLSASPGNESYSSGGNYLNIFVLVITILL